jgi:hypothetical protein
MRELVLKNNLFAGNYLLAFKGASAVFVSVLGNHMSFVPQHYARPCPPLLDAASFIVYCPYI